jgi:cytochrome c oxidase subunit 1
VYRVGSPHVHNRDEPILGLCVHVHHTVGGYSISGKVFNYLTTLWKGNIVYSPAMLFAIGLVSTFITGGLTGIILGDSALDINVHDTYFVVGHFHIVMGASAIFGMFAGVYHWFPKMYGRMMNKNLGYAHFWTTIISMYGVFFPMHFLGLAGIPRRYYDNTAFPILMACKT